MWLLVTRYVHVFGLEVDWLRNTLFAAMYLYVIDRAENFIFHIKQTVLNMNNACVQFLLFITYFAVF